MNPQVSTFDKLVDSLSTEEAQTMLTRIAENMKMSEDIQTDSKKEPLLSDTQIKKSIRINDEPFFIRLWLHLKSFFKALPIETVYEEELIRRLGKDLQHEYKQYINITAYDTDHRNFYLEVSSFVAPDVYSKLMYNTDPFSCVPSSQANSNLRSELLKKIDESFSLMTADYKAGMYQAANAIEWMRHFCELPIDKAVLRFTVNPIVEPSCSVYLLSAEIGMLASVLSTTKPIPDVVLQALFLLSKQDKLNDKTVNMDEESVEFISQASHALEAIKEFSVKIPILALARNTLNSMLW